VIAEFKSLICINKVVRGKVKLGLRRSGYTKTIILLDVIHHHSHYNLTYFLRQFNNSLHRTSTSLLIASYSFPVGLAISSNHLLLFCPKTRFISKPQTIVSIAHDFSWLIWSLWQAFTSSWCLYGRYFLCDKYFLHCRYSCRNTILSAYMPNDDASACN
jgi:hypothetical protein